MASSVHERLLMVVAANPGIGALTVTTIPAGYQGFVAGDNGKQFDIVIYEVDANGNPNGQWEVQAQSTYTSATTSLARTSANVIDGSLGQGTRVNFTGSAIRVANVLSTGGVWIIRQSGGSFGTNEVQLSHDGTNFVIKNNAVAVHNIQYLLCGNNTTQHGLFIVTSDNGQAVQIYSQDTNAALLFGSSAVNILQLNDANTSLGIRSDSQYGWSAGTVNGTTALDTGLGRVAAKVVGPTNGGASPGWMQNTAGEAALSSSFTNATATMAATNLSATVIAGRSYRIEAMIPVSNTAAAEGVQLDFGGGSCSATTFFAAATAVGSVTPGTLTTTSLTGAISYSVINGTDYLFISGFLKVNAGGTLILRAAENTTAVGTLTVGAGAWMALYDTVPL